MRNIVAGELMLTSLRYTILRLHHLATGRRIFQRLEELRRTQWLSRSELLAQQRNKLQQMVEYAYQYIPYYQRVFDQAGFHPDDLRRDLSHLGKLPVLTKAIVQEHFQELLTTEPRRRKQLTRMCTSGSTGQPMVFMEDSDYRDCFTADVQRHLEWAGCPMGQLHAYIWGASFEAGSAHSLRTRLINWTWNRFLINAYALTDESMAAFAEQILRRKPKVLYGYASSLHHFAQYVRLSPYQGITFDGVISSAAVLLPPIRRLIEETFQCRVFDRYGTKELGGIACECEAHTGLHISVESNYVEILQDGHPAAPGQVGDVVVTNLDNRGMPFIRYAVADESAWYDGPDCPCGRAAPMLKAVEGRTVDALKTRDGRMPWTGFNYASFGHPSIKQFQVVQKSLDEFVIRLVKVGDIPQANQDSLVHTIHATFGENVQVVFEYPDEIPVPPSGKHRYVISEVKDS